MVSRNRPTVLPPEALLDRLAPVLAIPCPRAGWGYMKYEGRRGVVGKGAA